MGLSSFRIRTYILAVGVVALLLWGAMMGPRSYRDYRLAETRARELSADPPPAEYPAARATAWGYR
ncbi:hypothetical protein OJF2_76570 [Aquisphaera giovannonii]|uniref:Uncharacterized protein n=1 Tax=Aquisphaera giovannonii TaxID=406548 RepID=A0A5B9WGA3_9BACT|nr:hypothetical protein [Aquisphaera giovannonii]QEH39045.1 hypothetical protein OJF2_76570 [Aquisphaera giovannonii]